MEFKLWNLDDARTAEWIHSLDAQKTLYKHHDNTYVLQALSAYEDAFEVHEINNVSYPDFTMLEGRVKELDAENVQKVYAAMHDLPLKYATSPRFWIGASHTFGWKYAQYRISEDLDKDSKENKDTIFLTHYFFDNPSRSHLPFMHCLSRLWWTGQLLHDDSASAEDPWGLLKALPGIATSFASHILILGSSSYTSRKVNVIGLMRALKRYQDAGVELKREHLVCATRYLNAISATILLDFLTEVDIEEQVVKGMKQKMPELPLV